MFDVVDGLMVSAGGGSLGRRALDILDTYTAQIGAAVWETLLCLFV
jgi:hypothetical protein